jgi:hypothetical protein
MNVAAGTRRCIFVASASLPDADNAMTKANPLHHGVADTFGVDGPACRGWMAGASSKALVRSCDQVRRRAIC